MNVQLAIDISMQLVPADHEEEIEAWQYLIDTGMAWKFKGWYERKAKRLIDEGVCTYTDRADERVQL
jgi:hypothetical protein